MFAEICLHFYRRTFDVVAPKNEGYIRATNDPFMNKAISNAIIDRKKLRNRFVSNVTLENKLITKTNY